MYNKKFLRQSIISLAVLSNAKIEKITLLKSMRLSQSMCSKEFFSGVEQLWRNGPISKVCIYAKINFFNTVSFNLKFGKREKKNCLIPIFPIMKKVSQIKSRKKNSTNFIDNHLLVLSCSV
jgi:hypothetical protein